MVIHESFWFKFASNPFGFKEREWLTWPNWERMIGQNELSSTLNDITFLLRGWMFDHPSCNCCTKKKKKEKWLFEIGIFIDVTIIVTNCEVY